ncbi:MAG: chemotaxis protein CheB [Myxococcota bacterium]|nr:chemotaxis protein CheB [Myxococcota bacterium]
MANHDLIVVGGSAGSLEVLQATVAKLPATLPASVLIAIHTSPTGGSQLPELLGHHSALPASYPTHEERIERGRVYVAPPDNQLLVRRGTMQVVRGPRENGHRPAVDALFRTASSSYGSRVIGVVLSGYQDCGTAGMISIKSRGGLGIVQNPDTASVPEMPRKVLSRVAVDYVIEPDGLADLLVELASLAAPTASKDVLDPAIRQLEGKELGTRAELVCPSCQGVLTESQNGLFHHFRCHVGHAFSLDSLIREQGDGLERALWAAVRSLEESAALSGRLATMGSGQLRARFAEKARTQCVQADLIRQILVGGESAFRTTDAAFAEEAETGEPAGTPTPPPSERE